MELQEQYTQLAAQKRDEITASEGTIAELSERLSSLKAENKIREQMATDMEELAASYAKKS